MKISDIVALNLWPDSKKTTTQKGISELEDLGYNLFYIGKNADLYTCPGVEPKVLLVRSDRCSVFDIPLNLLIDGKGVSQTTISNNGAEFAKEAGIRTAILSEKVDQTLNIAPRCQLMELCKPLEAEVNGDVVQFELIFRNYLTGSLFDACQNNLDPYGLNLASGLKQWHKFEIFVNSKNEWVLGDEVLTPESSRFISKEDFDAQNYISMDKQILRDFGKEDNWKEKAKALKSGEKLDVVVPQAIKDKILSGYTTILNRLSK